MVRRDRARAASAEASPHHTSLSCCSSDPTDLGTVLPATLAAYAAVAGQTVMIENYDGNAFWNFLTGGSGSEAAFVGGIGGTAGGSTCSDHEKVTADGIANGFTQPPVIGCWTHQAYNQAGHFAALGFGDSFFDAGADYPSGFSSLLSNGKTATGIEGVPEASTWAMMLIGFAGLGFLGYRRTAKVGAATA